ncbi:S-adenosylmethionine:tRNA ribosyltransferase-isomerase [Pontibacillus marinus]|uniref:S-adenosylmethionine tRNA ribosyltransferase n=1 Tax=Pontibacillus marinus BH030004 = DSM 16465 TaxID=1385511 RepID=A0A0A5G4D0_9BACI|nr:S-adenosylmethionine:tRNA ribosyltransferase-isomerase [Pontibacillus marinus]KGX85940.1 S-adenosylmethionine tRNA ribosyltransferase [Pontibacillus marinus BH030004 = DSM 16465]
MGVPYSFDIPDSLNASVPAELRTGARDHVKLMVLDGQEITHDHFSNLERYFREGDTLILNNSRTIPPVLKAKQGHHDIEVRLSRKVSSHEWEALLIGDLIQTNTPICFQKSGVEATVSGLGSEPPLVVLSFSLEGTDLFDFIYRFATPIRYEYIDAPWPLEMYQTVYASVPGSVEMPSAGRAFSWRLLKKLKKMGVQIGYVQLHTGLSYYERNRWPNPEAHPEEFHVPEETAHLVNQTRKNGGRVIATGTTVVRAMESCVNNDGLVTPHNGITRLYVGPGYQVRSIDGLLTGFHEPEASHLDMLTSFVEKDILMNAYQDALRKGYLWHEFGDMNLILQEKHV